MSETATGETLREASGPHVQTFKFTVDGRHFESAQPILTGAQIKAKASVDPSFGLFLEGHGHDHDKTVADNEPVDLRKPGLEKFYTAPPATFGVSR
jgi:hypothetical protein